VTTGSLPRTSPGEPSSPRAGLGVPVGPGVGTVETKQVRLFDESHPLTLASGATLTAVDVAYETYGTLNEAGTNAVFICHALTGDANAAGVHEGARKPGWWDNLIGPGRPVDTDHLFVVCANLLGGCKGTTGPASINPATGTSYGLDFPLLQVADFVTVHRALLAHLGVHRLLAGIGGSLGGMQILDWALSYPGEMANAVIIAASSRLSAQNIAFSAVAREAIKRDPGFKDGRYLEAGTNPDLGLSIARMMAHITYLSEEGMAEKFGRRFQDSETRRHGFGADFAVESYLQYQGDAFLNRFDALSYLYLTRVMDYFDPFAGIDIDRPGDAFGAVSDAGTRFCVLSFDTDWRFDTGHSRRITHALEHGRLPVTFREITSPWGHDSFLLPIPAYHDTLRAFLERAREEQL
jgi:homoserine O-acetyltransferase